MVQRYERTVPLLEHAVELLGHDLDGRRRGLAETRREQALLLGEIERVALYPPDRSVSRPAAPIDRLRGTLLRDAVAPALQAEARALAGEIARVAALQAEIAARRGELDAARAALSEARDRLATLLRQRAAAMRSLPPAEPVDGAALAKLGREAKDADELILGADKALDRADKARAHARPAADREGSDPTRPPQLTVFEPPNSRLKLPVMPVGGREPPADGETAAADTAVLTLAAAPAALVVAPFDGRVVYAGNGEFAGRRGLVLIIRHGGLYHSLLAGLGRADVRAGDWVMAGEPVGAMPEKPGAALQFALRRDGRPVDPRPWLEIGGRPGAEGREETPSGLDVDRKVDR